MWSSDNHMGGQMTEDELQELVETVAEAQPAPDWRSWANPRDIDRSLCAARPPRELKTPSRPNTVVPPAFRFRDRPVPRDRIPNNRVMASAWESDPDRRS